MIGATLIAGVTGSGKSYAETALIKKVIKEGAQVILIDPKMVELFEFSKDKACLVYADGKHSIADALNKAVDLMMARFKSIRATGNGAKEYSGKPIYIFVDEISWLVNTSDKELKKEYVEALTEIAQRGRAARVFLVACTQEATDKAVPANIKRNLWNIVCLRQNMRCQYRYLLEADVKPIVGMHGVAYIKNPSMIRPLKVKTDDVWNLLND